MATRVWVVRHGDRFDFDVGKEAWEGLAQVVNDPVLSDLGRLQAEQTAAAIYAAATAAGQPVTRVLTSPFVRCVQTADPIAGRFGTELLLDDSLFEVVWTKENFSVTERAKYFPRISLAYKSEPRPEPEESFPAEAMLRYGRAAMTLSSKFPGENIVLVSHAAGVSAIVSALTNLSVKEIGPVAPASIFCLELVRDGQYSIVQPFQNQVSHFNQPNGKTLPWPRQSDNTDEWGVQWINEGDNAPWLRRAVGDDKMP